VVTAAIGKNWFCLPSVGESATRRAARNLLSEWIEVGGLGGWFPRCCLCPPFIFTPALAAVDPVSQPVLGLRQGRDMKKRYILLIVLAGLIAYSGLIEPHWISQRTYRLTIQGLGAETVRIVHIADIHTTRLGFREARVTEMINRIDPDYIFLTGDLIKSRSRLSAGLDFLSGLKARHGTYLVPGNADRLLVRSIQRGRLSKDSLDYHILINESADCGNFTLVGLDDPVSDREDVGKAFAGIDEFKPVLVLSHFHPDTLLEDLETYNVDMVFSGHTHGGQFGLPIVVELVPYAARSEYIAGLYHHDGFLLSVTRGLGTNIFPLRFLCRPEILIFELRGE
jgi:predicted MPP superfamily phosphohydrolase